MDAERYSEQGEAAMIRDDATQRQVDAANPEFSTWVSANAGSGKTRVLTDRVARLLLNKVNPQNILCLTYTKAAATEMQNRLFGRLGAWSMMEDNKLRSELRTLGYEEEVTLNTLDDARQLFAGAIETPGGLKIQTIHSFCSSLLRRFPMEAGVSPQFREMEDQTAAHLRLDVLDDMASGSNAGLTKTFLAEFTGADFDDLLNEITRKKGFFDVATNLDHLAQEFGISASDTLADCAAMAIQPDDKSVAMDVSNAFSNQSATYKNFAKSLLSLNYDAPTLADFTEVKRLFLYAKDQTSKSVNFPQSNHSKAVEAAEPIIDELHAWMDRVAEAHQWALSIQALNRARILYEFAVPFIAAYEARKLATGQLDFDDLIGKAKSLLSDPNVAQWVLFRLDGGIDHVLVDEAQDTSPDQWSVIQSLTREFATGHGARSDVLRTIFVVGDKQQSIYSFQGADPKAFDRMQHHFQSALDGVDQTLQSVNLSHSFRSSQAILTAVDQTFGTDHREAIGKVQNHIAFQDKLPGRVDLWPVIEAAKDTKEEIDWTEPVDQVSDEHHMVQLANQVAEQIKHMLDHETLPIQDKDTKEFNHRRITPGDIMVLVQRRSELFHEIIAACKRADLAIAGADRLRVGAELAVKDITAVLQFLALPEDDLSLACALRSPIFGWSEEELYQLAHHRTDKFLWTALRKGDYPATFAILDDLRRQTDFLRPYDLIERILMRHDGRRNLLARLGQEAEDGIDALLSQALAYEGSTVPSLTGFLTWMQGDDLEIKRQLDGQGDQIRVMTVHGSKGLEAPIVILPDCAKRKVEIREELLPSGEIVLWKTRAENTPPAIAAVKEAMQAKEAAERLRLLYVAMTRAECWLIVAAAGEVDDSAWHSIVERGVSHLGVVDDFAGDLSIQRYSHLDWMPGEYVTVTKEEAVQGEVVVLEPVVKPEKSKSLSPSDLGGAKVIFGDLSGGDGDDAMTRGTAIHLLLEHLPKQRPQDQQAYGESLLQSFPTIEGLDHTTVTSVRDLLTLPELAFVFADDTLAEVGITGFVAALDSSILGTIDRLIVEPDRVLAIDFKSNRLVPDRAEDTPEGLLRQMGAYADALGQIYPDRKIETAILWTETGTLMPLPGALVSDALARVSVP